MSSQFLRRGLASAALVTLAAGTPAAAQRLLLSYSPSPIGTFAPVVTQSWDLATGRLEWSRAGPTLGPFFTSDGRYLLTDVSAGTALLRVQDVVTGATLDLPIDFVPAVAHPRRTEVFGWTGRPRGMGMDAGTLAKLDVTGLRTLGGCASGTTRSMALSADGVLLLALCDDGHLSVLDSASGTVLRTVVAAAQQ